MDDFFPYEYRRNYSNSLGRLVFLNINLLAKRQENISWNYEISHHWRFQLSVSKQIKILKYRQSSVSPILVNIYKGFIKDHLIIATEKDLLENIG